MMMMESVWQKNQKESGKSDEGGESSNSRKNNLKVREEENTRLHEQKGREWNEEIRATWKIREKRRLVKEIIQQEEETSG